MNTSKITVGNEYGVSPYGQDEPVRARVIEIRGGGEVVIENLSDEVIWTNQSIWAHKRLPGDGSILIHPGEKGSVLSRRVVRTWSEECERRERREQAIAKRSTLREEQDARLDSILGDAAKDFRQNCRWSYEVPERRVALLAALEAAYAAGQAAGQA